MNFTWQELKSERKLNSLQEIHRTLLSILVDEKIDISKYQELPDIGWINKALFRSSSKFTMMVIGQVSSGKSSFINSLFGWKLFQPKDTPTDGVISVLLPSDSTFEYAEKELYDGSIEIFNTIEDAKQFVRQDETPIEDQLKCKEVRFYLNEPWLKQIRIINTPGLGDRMKAFELSTLDYLKEDESDLVVWTFFPETAANKIELGIFADSLAKRHKSVLGIVTRIFEGHENDSNYDPNKDTSLIGENGVIESLKNNLGSYLSNIILYDSHNVRKLVSDMKTKPELETNPDFVDKLNRTGYIEFRHTMNSLLGLENQNLQKAQVSLFLKKCKGHTIILEKSTRDIEILLQQKAELGKQEIENWNLIEDKIIGPWKNKFKDEVRSLAAERSKELVIILGNAAADAVQENFNLFSTLGRTLTSWTGLCDPMSDKLTEHIDKAVTKKIESSKYNERMENALKELIEENLHSFERQINKYLDVNNIDRNPINPDIHTPGTDTDTVLGTAISAALKPVIAAILKQIAKKLEEKAAEQTIKEVTEKVATKTAEKVAEKAGGATLTKVAGIITLVLIPFDIAKLTRDFSKGKSNLIETIRARYLADRPLYDMRIFEILWEISNKLIKKILIDARVNSVQQKESYSHIIKSIQEVIACRESLNNISLYLDEIIGD